MTHAILTTIETNDLQGFRRALNELLDQPDGQEQLQSLVSEESHSPTTLAASLNRVNMLQAMATAGVDMRKADIRSRTPLHEAADQGHEAAVSELLKDRWLDRDPRTDLGETPLHLAADKGHSSVIQILIGRGADPAATGVFGNQALHYAARSGRVDAIDVLRANEAYFLAPNADGDTPAHLAAAENQPAAIRAIFRHGGLSAVNTPNNEGNLPIHLAAFPGFPDVVRALAETGAPLDVQNKDGNTAASVVAMELKRRANRSLGDIYDESGHHPDVAGSDFARVHGVLSELGVDMPPLPEANVLPTPRAQWKQLMSSVPASPAKAAAGAAAVPVRGGAAL